MDDNPSSLVDTHQMSDQDNQSSNDRQSTDCVTINDESKHVPDEQDTNVQQLELNQQGDQLKSEQINQQQLNEQKNDNYSESDANVLVKQEQSNDSDEKNTISQISSVCEQVTDGELVNSENANEITSNEPTQQSGSSKQSINAQATADSYTDFGGVNLEEFLFDLLQNNQKERTHLLKIEQELISLVKDESRNVYRFPPMSSYHRMLVHRVAAYFGLEHNIDPKGNCVVVNKQEGITRIPEFRFRDQIKQNSPEEPKKLILKRNTNSEDGLNSNDSKSMNNSADDARRTRSFEERNEYYEKVKARIFNQRPDSTSQLSNIDENDPKCNSTKSSSDSSRSYNSNSCINNNYNYDSGQSSSYFTINNNTGYQRTMDYDDVPDSEYINSNGQYNNDYMKSTNYHMNKLNNTTLDDSGTRFYNNKSNSNTYKGKPMNNKSIKTGNNKPIKSHHQFYQPAPQMLNPLDPQQQIYSNNWMPADLNAQQQADYYAKHQQLYQPLAYNQITHPNQKLFFLYPTDTHSFSNDKMMPNSVVLPSTNTTNLNPINGQSLPGNQNANKMEKENMNSYVTAQMSNMSLGSMNPNATDINDVQNRSSNGIPICYVKSPYYPIPGHSNQMPNDLAYQSMAHQQPMLLLNPQFNTPLNGSYNRPNSILPAPSVGMTNNQRFTNHINYPYPVNGSTSHLEMNQMYHMSPYIMPNIRQPLLPTPTSVISKTMNLKQLAQSANKHSTNNSLNNTSRKKLNVHQDNNIQTTNESNGFINDQRKKINTSKMMDKKSSPPALTSPVTAIKPKISNVSSVKNVGNGSTSNNGLTTKV